MWNRNGDLGKLDAVIEGGGDDFVGNAFFFQVDDIVGAEFEIAAGVFDVGDDHLFVHITTRQLEKSCGSFGDAGGLGFDGEAGDCKKRVEYHRSGEARFHNLKINQRLEMVKGLEFGRL